VAGESTVYPILKRLEAEGLLASSWSAEGGAPRKYYQLTEEGMAFLERGAEQWRALANAMDSLEAT
jgi:PadR family transcriptional regulator, regulatory protein PadR